MVVSTGVGGGLILDSRVIEGASGNAGHIGHVVVDPEDGPECACGGRGCLEAIARGPALVAWAQREGWRPGQPGATAKDLAGDAAQGHPVGLAAMRRAGRALGIAISSATHLCDLEVAAVGGGLSQAGAMLFEPLEECAARARQAQVRAPAPRGTRRARPERRARRRRGARPGRRPLLDRRLTAANPLHPPHGYSHTLGLKFTDEKSSVSHFMHDDVFPRPR